MIGLDSNFDQLQGESRTDSRGFRIGFKTYPESCPNCKIFMIGFKAIRDKYRPYLRQISIGFKSNRDRFQVMTEFESNLNWVQIGSRSKSQQYSRRRLTKFEINLVWQIRKRNEAILERIQDELRPDWIQISTTIRDKSRL